jgi:hypothetical protein
MRQPIREGNMITHTSAMNGEHWPELIDKLVEFDKWLVKIQELKEITNHFKGMYKIYLKLMKKPPIDHNM